MEAAGSEAEVGTVEDGPLTRADGAECSAALSQETLPQAPPASAETSSHPDPSANGENSERAVTGSVGISQETMATNAEILRQAPGTSVDASLTPSTSVDGSQQQAPPPNADLSQASLAEGETPKEKEETSAKRDMPPPPSAHFKAPMSLAALRRNLQKDAPSTVFDRPSDKKEAKSEKPEEKKEPTEKQKEEQSSKRQSGKSYSPAEKLKQQEVPFPYIEPKWGGPCSNGEYNFEVIKNGTVVDTIALKSSKSYFVFGRLPSCDITMEHPSLSRYHAVVQYCATPSPPSYQVGWYLYDLDSTHGTWVNKNKVRPRTYIRLRVGYVVKLGGSTRLNILQGPEDDQDQESELSVTEMKEQRQRQKMEAEVLRQAEITEAESKAATTSGAADGCNWGIDETDPEEISSENPFALNPEPQNEELYIDDPKKALRGFFEREGHDLPEYEVIEESRGRYKCQVELPIDTPSGEPVVAMASVSGKKKEAVAACALEACRLLDRYGELRKATHESRARKKKNWEENDYYDSDDDTFLDRTGDIEKKRKQRMNREKKSSQKAETYESLTSRLAEVEKEIATNEEKLQAAKEQAASFDNDGLDAFDAYMMALKSGALDTKTKTRLKREIFELKQEKLRLDKLINIAKPALPSVKKNFATSASIGAMFGKKKSQVKSKPIGALPLRGVTAPQKASVDFEEEEEDSEDEEASTQQSNTNTESSATSSESRVKDRGRESDNTMIQESGREISVESRGLTQPQVSSQANSDIPGDDRGLKKPSEDSTVKKVVERTVSNQAMSEGVGHSDTVCDNFPSDSASRSDPTNGNSTSTRKDLPTSTLPSKRGPQPDGTVTMTTPDDRLKDAANQLSGDDVTVAPLKKRKTVPAHVAKKPQVKSQPQKYEEVLDNPDYATWVPPKGQSGDGRTHLNEKYGY